MKMYECLYEVVGIDLASGVSATQSDAVIRIRLKPIGGPVSDITPEPRWSEAEFRCSPKTLRDEGITLGSFYRLKFGPSGSV